MRLIKFYTTILAYLFFSSEATAQCDITSTTPGSACAGGTATLSATGQTGNTINWYTQPTGGTPVATGNTFMIPNVTTSGTYYAEATGGSAPIKDSLDTKAPNNGQAGVYFDCEPKNDLTVTGFNFMPRGSATADVSVYFKTGTFVGSETTSGDWTLLGTATKMSLTANVLTRIPLTLSQQLVTGNKYAFYIVVDGTTLGYTNGTTLGASYVSNSDIEVFEGKGSGGLFSSSLYTVRNFAGTILYEKGGQCFSTREAVTLTVIDNTDITDQSIYDSTCTNLPSDFYVKADGIVNAYRWQIFDVTTSSFVDINSSPFVINSDTLNVTTTPDTLDGAIIRCITIGQCGDDTSANMNIVVSPLPKIATSPRDTTITAVAGAKAAFKVTTTGSNIRYQWQAAVPGGNTFVNLNDGGIYSGTRTDMLVINGVSRVQDQFIFRCVIFGTGSCIVDPDTSETALLIVPPTASVANINMADAITVFPNPAGGSEILMRVDNIDADNYTITDKMGKVITTGSIDKNGNTSINITNMPAGIYIISVTDSKNEMNSFIRFTKL